MIDYKTWKILKLNLFEATDAKISGPGVKAMQAAFHDMAARGAPNEYNKIGCHIKALVVIFMMKKFP